MKISKKRYLQGFCVAVVLLGMVRCFFPGIAADRTQPDVLPDGAIPVCSIVPEPDTAALAPMKVAKESVRSRFMNADGSLVKHRIFSVPHFGRTFPDQNDVQLASAKRWGVEPVKNREEAERHKKHLVYVGNNAFFYIDNLKSSIPYLVPRAAILLQDIGRAYYDSLQIKGIPLHKIIVTSVMRSKDDVAKLSRRNQNTTPNSAHLYGTTFDVCYNRYKTIEDPAGPKRRAVTNDTLKWVLSEVLRDKREEGRCYIKYEVHQGCFHITVR